MQASDYELDDGMEYLSEKSEIESEAGDEAHPAAEEEDEEGEGEGGQGEAPSAGAAPLTGDSRFKKVPTSSAAKVKGVVHLSRIPFGMTPVVLRNMFTDVGPVGRMYLKVKEARGTREQKKKQRQRRHYSEGWVEFLEKKHAKRAALLNCTPVGGSRRTTYAHELWTIKYLSGFTWSDLKDEQILKKEYMKREVARVQKEGLREAEDFRRQHLDRKSGKGGKKGGKGKGGKGSKGAKGAKGDKDSKGKQGGDVSGVKKASGKKRGAAEVEAAVERAAPAAAETQDPVAKKRRVVKKVVKKKAVPA